MSLRMKFLPCSAALILAVGCLTPAESDAPPVVTLSSPDAGSEFESGVPIVFRGRVEDDVDSPAQLEVSWFSTVDGALDVETTVGDDGLVEMTAVQLSPAGQEIEIQVTDSRGNTARDSVYITVVASPVPPTISVLFPGPDEGGFEGVTYDFLALVEDAEDAPEMLSVTFATDWGSGGDEEVFCTSQAQPTSLVSCSAELDAGLHTLTYTVTDTSGLSGSATTVFEVQQHDHPILTGEFSGTVTGSVVYQGENLSCFGEGELMMGGPKEHPMVVDEGILECALDGVGFPLSYGFSGVEVPGEALVNGIFGGEALLVLTIGENEDGLPLIIAVLTETGSTELMMSGTLVSQD